MILNLLDIFQALTKLYTRKGVPHSMKPWVLQEKTNNKKRLDLLARLSALPGNVCAAVAINEENNLIVAHNYNNNQSQQHIKNVELYCQNPSDENRQAAINSFGSAQDRIRGELINNFDDDE